jgi:hypothetical protein
VPVHKRGIERSVRLTALEATDEANAEQRRLEVRATPDIARVARVDIVALR